MGTKQLVYMPYLLCTIVLHVYRPTWQYAILYGWGTKIYYSMQRYITAYLFQ